MTAIPRPPPVGVFEFPRPHLLAPPDWCLGQESLVAVEPNRGGRVAADTLCWPHGISACGDLTAGADSGSDRVSVWR